MERIAIAMQDGGTGAGAQHGDAGREANLILSRRRTSIWDPRGGGTFWFQIFIQASSPEIWRKTIFGGEGGCLARKWGGLFLGYLLRKKFTGGTEKALEPRARARSSRRGHPNSQFEPLRCRLRRRGTGGNEAR